VRGHEIHLLLKPVPPADLLLEIGKMVNATAPFRPHTMEGPSIATAKGKLAELHPNRSILTIRERQRGIG
jgi:hypothetical protein